MGVNPIDLYSLGHLAGGVLTRLVVFPNIKWLSFTVGFILHALVELIEHEYNPINGKILETKINKVFDILFFLIGWFVTDYFYDKIKLKGIHYYFWLFVFIYFTTVEFLREIFPYNKFLDGAFVKE